jgi:hypothetical protein
MIHTLFPKILKILFKKDKTPAGQNAISNTGNTSKCPRGSPLNGTANNKNTVKSINTETWNRSRHAHASASATGSGLDHQWKTYATSLFQSQLIISQEFPAVLNKRYPNSKSLVIVFIKAGTE